MSWKFKLFLFLGAPARGYMWVLALIFGIEMVEQYTSEDGDEAERI